MTIKEDDRKQFQATVNDFQKQHEVDSCFPTVVKNVLDELADRENDSAFRHSISDIGDALEYNEGHASRSDRLSNRLDPLIKGANWETCYMSGVDYSQLKKIIELDKYSLPICELHEQYFEDIGQYTDQYVVEHGIDGSGRWKHTVIPFKFNDTKVLYFDPYISFFEDPRNLDDAGGLEVPIRVFREWWNRPTKRWAMWFEPKEQSTIQDFTQ